MQNNQNNNKRNFYKDVALQQEMSKKLVEKLNKILPPEQRVTEDEVRDLPYAQPNKLKRKEKVEKLKQNNSERHHIRQEYMEDHGITNVTSAQRRALPYLFELESEMKDDINNMMLDQIYGKNGNQNLQSRNLDKVLDFDMTKVVCMSDDFDKIIDHFEKNLCDMKILFAFSSTLDKDALNPQCSELATIIKNNMPLFDGCSYEENVMNLSCSTSAFLLPDRIMQIKDLDILLQINNLTQEIMYEYKNQLDDSIQFEGKVCKTTANEMGFMIGKNQMEDVVEFERAQIKNGTMTKDFLQKGGFEVDGKPANINEVIKAQREKKPIEFVERTFEQKRQLEQELDKPFLTDFEKKQRLEKQEYDKECAVFDENEIELGSDLAKFAKQLQGTSSLFNRGSQEFKEMNEQVQKFTKMYYQAHPDLAQKVGYKVQPDNISKDDLHKAAKEMKNKMRDYLEYKNNNPKAASKTGEKRMNLASEIFSKMTGGSKLSRYQSDKIKDNREKEERKAEIEARKAAAIKREAKKNNPERISIKEYPELKSRIDNDLVNKNDKVVINAKSAPTLEKSLEMNNGTR